MSLVVVGSVAYDGVETPHGRVDRMLGGAATYISLASSFFTKTRIVAHHGDDAGLCEKARGEGNIRGRSTEHSIDAAVRRFYAVIGHRSNDNQGHFLIVDRKMEGVSIYFLTHSFLSHHAPELIGLWIVLLAQGAFVFWILRGPAAVARQWA